MDRVFNIRLLASVVFFVKCFYSTCSCTDVLFAAVERMALRADFDFDIFTGSRSGFEFCTASTDNLYGFIFWVNSFFHFVTPLSLKFTELRITVN